MNFLFLIGLILQNIFFLHLADGRTHKSVSLISSISTGVDISNNRRKVILGGKFHLNEGEYLEELMILGGQSEISGKVDTLRIMGGKVHLTESAEITNEIINVGGGLIIDPGAKAEQGTSGLFDSFNNNFPFTFDSKIENNFFHFFESPFWIWGFRLTKLIFLLLISVFLTSLAPQFFDQVKQSFLVKTTNMALWGFGYIASYIPLALLLVITLFGIFFLPVQFLFTIYLLVIGCAAVMTGLMEKLNVYPSSFSTPLRVAGSVILFEWIGWLPYFGYMLHLVVSIVGIGASFFVLWKRLWSR